MSYSYDEAPSMAVLSDAGLGGPSLDMPRARRSVMSAAAPVSAAAASGSVSKAPAPKPTTGSAAKPPQPQPSQPGFFSFASLRH
jgi:hypothetical protein